MAGRGEVDTSSQFESVKDAVSRFGGGAVVTWRPDVPQFQLRPEEIELMKVEEQTVKLEMQLFAKERETFKVLKELESTKNRFNSLNSELERETKCMSKIQINEEKSPVFLNFYKEILAQNLKKSPNSTLIELQQAKNNLNKNTIEILKGKIEEEKLLMEKTREKIREKNDKVKSLEQDLDQIISEIEIKNKKGSTKKGSTKMVEDYKSEISKLIFEIEQTKSKIKTTEVRYLMAKKMKEASNSTEELFLSRIKTLNSNPNPNPNPNPNSNSNSNSEITLSVEEHAELIFKAQEAEKISQNKIEKANKDVEEANKSKNEIFEKIEEAKLDVEISRTALNAALKREEIANKGKLESEEALRRWRSNYHNTPNNNNKIIHNSTKFKNSSTNKKVGSNNNGLLDMNGLSLVKSSSNLSIGQILNIKLTRVEEKKCKVKSSTKPKVSLGQILNQSYEGYYCPFKIDDATCQSKMPSKKKKRNIGFVVFTLLMAKQRRKKKQGLNSQNNFSSKVV